MSKHYYWTCPNCGSNLDPGESCDCKKDDSSNVDNYKSVQGGEDSNVERDEK